MGMFEAAVMAAKETGLKLKPSETYQASVSSNPEVSICGLRDAVDSAAGKSGFGRPLFADVLRRHTVRIERTCIGDKAR
jgi:hypothetical protein